MNPACGRVSSAPSYSALPDQEKSHHSISNTRDISNVNIFFPFKIFSKFGHFGTQSDGDACGTISGNPSGILLLNQITHNRQATKEAVPTYNSKVRTEVKAIRAKGITLT